MLTVSELSDLLDRLRDTPMLSVYVTARTDDPAARHEWRRVLDQQLAAQRRALDDAPHAEREAFAQAVAHVTARLPVEDELTRSRAWVAFATADALVLAEPLCAEVPPLVRWGRGPAVAGYLHATASARPVIVALLSAGSTRLFRCEPEGLTALPPVTVAVTEREATHMGSMPAPGFHVGTQGETANDAMQRRRRTQRQRLVAATAERLAALAPDGEWIVLGGTTALVAAMRQALPLALAGRAIGVPSLIGAASDAEVQRAAEQGAATLRAMHDLVTVDDVLERYGADARGAAGPDATRRALGAGAVHELLVTRRFLEQYPEAAEHVSHATIGQGGTVRAIIGAAADRLDGEGHGIGAVLRFVPGAVPGAGPAGPAAPAAPAADRERATAR